MKGYLWCSSRRVACQPEEEAELRCDGKEEMEGRV